MLVNYILIRNGWTWRLRRANLPRDLGAQLEIALRRLAHITGLPVDGVALTVKKIDRREQFSETVLTMPDYEPEEWQANRVLPPKGARPGEITSG